MTREWAPPDPVIEDVGNNTLIVRDDRVDGGSKVRFLPALMRGASEVVYGGPYCGGAPVALAVAGRHLGIPVTIFYAHRAQPHRRQLQVMRYGGSIVWVPMGFMSNVQAKARAYAKERGAKFLPLGFDLPEAVGPFVDVITRTAHQIDGQPDEVWCATSSGMLATSLAVAFPSSTIKAVTVGLKSKWSTRIFPKNVELVECRYKYEQESKARGPVPLCPNYEAKAWEVMQQRRAKSARALFWNVIGQ